MVRIEVLGVPYFDHIQNKKKNLQKVALLPTLNDTWKGIISTQKKARQVQAGCEQKEVSLFVDGPTLPNFGGLSVAAWCRGCQSLFKKCHQNHTPVTKN